MSVVAIKVGISCTEEIEPLIQAGASEFYGGLLSSQQTPLINHRFDKPEYNFASFRELQKAIKICHQHKKRIYIAANECFSPAKLYPAMIKSMLRILDAGADGFILSDFFLLHHLSKNLNFKNPSIGICLSSLTNCFNAKTVDFYKRFNITRIVLPQQIYAREAEDMIRYSGLETEVFFHKTNNCPNLDGRCHFCSYTVYKKNLSQQGFPCRSKFNILNPESIKNPELIYSKWGVHTGINDYSNLYGYVKTGISAVKIGLRDKTKIPAKLDFLKHLYGVLKRIDDTPIKQNFLKRVNHA